MTKKSGALVEAQGRLRAQMAGHDLVLRAWFNAEAVLAAMTAEEEALRVRFQAELDHLAVRRNEAVSRLHLITAALAVALGDDARTAAVLGTSEKQVATTRRSVPRRKALELVDELVAAGTVSKAASATDPAASSGGSQ